MNTKGKSSPGDPLRSIRRSGPRRALLFLAALSTLIASSGLSAGDGLPAYRDDRGWHVLGEEAQEAVVTVRGDRESMLLRITLAPDVDEQRAQEIVWFTPIPATPKDAHIEVLHGFPDFSGRHPVAALTSALHDLLSIMAGAQLWPLPALMALSKTGAGVDLPTPGTTVHQSLLLDGIQVELVSIESLDALRAHLGERVSLPADLLLKLSQYVGRERCIAFARVADLSAFRKAVQSERSDRASLALAADFPSATGFFPLAISSGLPGNTVAVSVTSAGLKRPLGPVPQGLSVEHYVGSYHAPRAVLDALHLSPSGTAEPYTVFRWIGSPRELQQDLRFAPGAPTAISLAARWSGYRYHEAVEVGLSAVLYTVLSVLAAISARTLWPAATRPSRRRAAIIGLGNLATLVGMVVAAQAYASGKGIRARVLAKYVAAASVILCGEIALFAIILEALDRLLLLRN